MTKQKVRDVFAPELRRADFRRGAPPIRARFSVVKANSPELPRIAKNERAFRLLQDKVVMFAGAESGGLSPHCSAHPEMNSKPAAAREAKEHLFPAGDGTSQLRAR